MELLSLYNAIHECRWQPLDLHGEDEVGPHLSILGVVDGKDVWLRVVADNPSNSKRDRCSICRSRACSAAGDGGALSGQRKPSTLLGSLLKSLPDGLPVRPETLSQPRVLCPEVTGH
ncbi:MAG: hypothetical protein R3B90_11860 [Planctomycetaceae bacterium]